MWKLVYVLQVQSTLQNFFLNIKDELYLLQIEAKKVQKHIFFFPLMSAMFNEYKRGEHKFLVILYCPLLYMCMFSFCDMMINYYNGKIKGDLASKSVIVRASLLTQSQRTMDKHISKLYPSSIIIGLRPWLCSKTLWLVWKMFLRMLFRYSRSIFYYLKLAS